MDNQFSVMCNIATESESIKYYHAGTQRTAIPKDIGMT